MFQRTAIEQLRMWAGRKNRKPLIIRGARQVGKTSMVLQFSGDFKCFIHLNLEKQDDRTIFSRHNEISRLFDAICLHKQIRPIRESTLLFIDEIQYSSEAVGMLRYFYEELPWLHVIAAGSLLESLISQNISFPVGRVEYLPLRPCSFREFLGALDDEQSMDLLRQIPFPDYGHEHLLSQFLKYCLIGGMPEVLDHYRNIRNVIELNSIYETLVASYLDDAEKYAKNNTMRQVIRFVIRKAFDAAATKTTFQGFGNSSYRNREISEAFKTLEKAFLLQLIYPVTTQVPPASVNLRRSPKLQMLDTGLVNYMSANQAEVLAYQDHSQSFKGRIAEHIAGQELLNLSTSVLFSLKYWTRIETNSTAEIDFVWQLDDRIIPVEVKAGKSGKLRSLHQFMDRAPHQLAVRIYSGILSVERTRTLSGKSFILLNLPFYLINRLDDYIRYAEGS